MNLLDHKGKRYYQCNLPALIKRAGMTQSALATAIGMNPKSFHRVVHGLNIPYSETAGKIAAALDVTRNDIWPEYATIMAERKEQIIINTTKGREIQKAQREAGNNKRGTGLYKESKSAYSELWRHRQRYEQVEDAGPVLPVTVEEGRERDLVLRARFVSADKIEDDAWCRRMAGIIHQWILNNTVWGIYRHLRAIMAAEQMAANERAERAAAAVGGGQ